MKKYFTILCILFVFRATAQKTTADSAELSLTNFSTLDSLEQLLAKQNEDTSKVILLGNLSYGYAFRQAEKGVYYGQKGLQLAEKLNYKRGKPLCAYGLGFSFWALGNYNTALHYAFACLHQF